MKLSNGQKEYLLELLSGEYFLPAEYRPYLKEAINRYSTCRYSSEDLDFLTGLPISLTADLYLNNSSSLNSFIKRFALWLNVLEYNIYDDSPKTIAFLLNPDPSSAQKLLQIISDQENIQVISVAPIQFQAQTRSNPAITTISGERRLHTPALACIWDYQQINELLADFLTFANQNPGKIPGDYSNYLDMLESSLNRTKKMRFSWLNLRSKAQNFAQISPDYVFAQRSLGLIMPSNLEFINLVNSQAQAPKPKPQAPAFTNPFAPEIRLFQKFKSNLKLPAPQAFSAKAPGMNTFKLPSPFSKSPFGNNCSPFKAPQHSENCQKTKQDGKPKPQPKSTAQPVKNRENLSNASSLVPAENLAKNTNTEKLITYNKFIEPQA